MKIAPENKNSQALTDLFYMLNAGKELEKNFISPNINKSINYINKEKENNNNKENQNNNIDLKKEVIELKNTIITFEEKYGYNSPYHDDIINKLKQKKGIQNLTNEIAQKIIELYENKYYNDCYDLWNIYGFKPLFIITPEENYEILRHLTKVKNELYKRKKLLNNLENFNLFNDNSNVYFETGFSFKQINNKNLNNENNFSKKNNINNESFKTYNDDIVKQKIKENNLLLEEIKKRNLNYSYS